jgi:hypothetical protein
MPEMTRLLSALLACVTALTCTAAEVYRWRDADGNVIFSDKPREGAEKIELRDTTVVPALRPTTRLSPDESEDAPRALPYETLLISEPPADETLRNVQSVTVNATSSPALQTAFGHRLQLYLDGGAHGQPTTTGNWTLNDVERGAHSLEVAILDGTGAEVARSAPSSFYLHRQSAITSKKAGASAP